MSSTRRCTCFHVSLPHNKYQTLHPPQALASHHSFHVVRFFGFLCPPHPRCSFPSLRSAWPSKSPSFNSAHLILTLATSASSLFPSTLNTIDNSPTFASPPFTLAPLQHLHLQQSRRYDSDILDYYTPRLSSHFTLQHPRIPALWSKAKGPNNACTSAISPHIPAHPTVNCAEYSFISNFPSRLPANFPRLWFYAVNFEISPRY